MGRLGLAILKYIENNGRITAKEFLSTRRSGLGATMGRLQVAPDVQSIYNDLKEADNNSLRTVVWRLKQKGLLRQKNGSLSVTNSGQEAIDQTNTKKNWDGKWRMVFFDIPEKEKAKRNWLRKRLNEQNFRIIQKSVFVGKYPLGQDIFERIHEMGLSKNVRMITIGEIDDETTLRV